MYTNSGRVFLKWYKSPAQKLNEKHIFKLAEIDRLLWGLLAWKEEEEAEQVKLSGYEQIEQPLHSGRKASGTACDYLINVCEIILKYKKEYN